MTMALAAGNSIVMTNHYMFVARSISSETIKIHVARAEEGFLQFRLARLPSNYHITDHFTVMDTSEKTVFLYVSDNRFTNPVGSLFVSDGLGYRFSHSLENIIKRGSAVDFETIESMDGTFMANRYDKDHNSESGVAKAAGNIQQISDDDVEDYEKQKAEKSRMSTGNSNKKQQQIVKEKKGDNLQLESFLEKIKTYITHNKGSSWELIPAPTEDMNGKSTKCFMEDGCSLHLQMYSHSDVRFAPPYSQESAVGIVMAIGTLGNRLELDRGSRRGTFLTRNGGLSWS
jgi:hypothetical protein